MSDFNGEDYDFAAGSIKGMRSWGIDDHCRLHGVTHKEVWRPGVNTSVCQARQEVPCPKMKKNRRDIDEIEPGRWYVNSFSSSIGYEGGRVAEPQTCKMDGCNGYVHRLPAKHTFDPKCQCGFWAYDEVGFAEHGAVVGIIEGFGKTTIGTKGFRCERARIVALCRGKLSLSVWLRLQTLYPDAQFFADRDEMVQAHGAVMKSFTTEPDEQFWTTPVKAEPDTYMSQMRTIYSTSPQRWMLGGQP